MPDESPIIPAATVAILRDDARGGGIEALMVRRNSRLAFAGGMWVFPGGRVDARDRDGLEPEDDEWAARRAAVRETEEEAGVVLDPASLVWFSHWTPPPIAPKRFGTYFFAAPAPAADVAVTIDGGEIHDHGWLRPADAMRRRNALEIELAPPTWITLETLARFTTVDEALRTLTADDPEFFMTQIVEVDGGLAAVYHGDAAYDPGADERARGRHRLWMVGDDWRYERDGWT